MMNPDPLVGVHNHLTRLSSRHPTKKINAINGKEFQTLKKKYPTKRGAILGENRMVIQPDKTHSPHSLMTSVRVSVFFGLAVFGNPNGRERIVSVSTISAQKMACFSIG
ncbi:hypothetical protein [Alcaligenes faecalis]|uniref:hypothetical protein n=1 Tax=Alcaligenes aquatilis TaxID=323284 RepID=UPI002AA7C3D7|nr:hypothetical protein [Alcaligenes faecalis]